MRPEFLFVSIAVVACGDDPLTLDQSSSTNPSADSATPDTPAPPACDASLTSVCGNPRSIVQGQVRLGEGITTKTSSSP